MSSAHVRQDLVRDAARAEAEPDRQTHQGVTQYTKEHRLPKPQTGLGVDDFQSGQTDRAAPKRAATTPQTVPVAFASGSFWCARGVVGLILMVAV
jgi:hypothetical protein